MPGQLPPATWECHNMEMLSSVLALCEGNQLVHGGFPWQMASNADLRFYFGVSMTKLHQTNIIQCVILNKNRKVAHCGIWDCALWDLCNGSHRQSRMAMTFFMVTWDCYLYSSLTGNQVPWRHMAPAVQNDGNKHVTSSLLFMYSFDAQGETGKHNTDEECPFCLMTSWRGDAFRITGSL